MPLDCFGGNHVWAVETPLPGMTCLCGTLTEPAATHAPAAALRGGTRREIDDISAKVHEQWMATKRAQGVTSRRSETGEELMVPYATLSESAKELDRGSVRSVLKAIEACAALATEATPTPLEELRERLADSERFGNRWMSLAAKMEERLVRLVPRGQIADADEPVEWFERLDAVIAAIPPQVTPREAPEAGGAGALEEREACARTVEALLDTEWAKVWPSKQAVKVCAAAIRQRAATEPSSATPSSGADASPRGDAPQ